MLMFNLNTFMPQARATTGRLTPTAKRCLTMETSAAKGRGSLIPSPVVIAFLGLQSQVTVSRAALNSLGNLP